MKMFKLKGNTSYIDYLYFLKEDTSLYMIAPNVTKNVSVGFNKWDTRNNVIMVYL